MGVELLKAALAAYDQMIGLDLDDLSLDGSITKSPCGGELSGRSPVDRGKQGTKRSVVTEGTGIPVALVAAGATRHDSPLFESTMRQIPDMIGALPERPCVHLAVPGSSRRGLVGGVHNHQGRHPADSCGDHLVTQHPAGHAHRPAPRRPGHRGGAARGTASRWR